MQRRLPPLYEPFAELHGVMPPDVGELLSHIPSTEQHEAEQIGKSEQSDTHAFHFELNTC